MARSRFLLIGRMDGNGWGKRRRGARGVNGIVQAANRGALELRIDGVAGCIGARPLVE